ncbi:hypothetical protein QI349_02835 [Staphylococcus saprophyticus]|nr:hypothetical protein [Staphylococcus saprophyticus]
MPTVLFEEVESEIIDDKLQEGYLGIKFLLDVPTSLSDSETLSLHNILKFCLIEINSTNYYTFAIRAFSDDRQKFESDHDVSIDTVRKLILKHIKADIGDSEGKIRELALALNKQMEIYKNT